MSVNRYDRQIRLKAFGARGQELLGAARVLVVGAGGLGVPVCQYLNAMGVGTLGIVDGDTIEETNLHRQPIYTPSDCGNSKITILGQKLQEQNPDTRIELHPTFLQPSNALDLVDSYDLVVDATDRIPTRYLLDDVCVIKRIPWIYGALHGFEGQLSVFNYKEGPTYRCLFPQIPKPGEIPDCNQLGTLGILPGIIGSLQALEAVKVICGLGEVLSGKLLLFSALDQESRQVRFQKDPSQESREVRDEAHYNSGFCGTGEGVSLSDYLERSKSDQAPLLVDVREPEEFEAFHLPEAQNFPLMELEQRIAELDHAGAVYLICHSGSRSAQAYQKLEGRLQSATLSWISGGMRNLEPEVS
ncbi:HesA/MoeB/ThiF family protein [Robiginitalea aurantiaca]|uniref:HesA/MoeB/ThiF family protein n=1 Tax=Robiginitalea aurantiaca TaxID=3056915 RepID=A0ABT7WFQ3_9FLAO|nr:HesA/MoeB/ThiF family protein [Robiginitalea aurantiaca]MDM9631746.1 HesA/MoeB/ThiF family protein [Robiginitalea aurantiaca]